MELVWERNDYNEYEYFTVQGTSWLYYGGIQWESFLVQGFAIKFSEDEYYPEGKHIDFDSSLYLRRLYREEGYLGSIRYLKLKFVGVDYDDRPVELDTIFWESGSISVHIVQNEYPYTIYSSYFTDMYSEWPSSETFYIESDTTDITFSSYDNYNNYFDVQYQLISIDVEIPYKCLLRQGSEIFTVVNGELRSLGSITVNSDLFINSGVPQGGILGAFVSELNNPEILVWCKSEVDDPTEVYLVGPPKFPKETVTEVENIPEGSHIRAIEAISSLDIKYCISFDGGETWKYYKSKEWHISTSLEEGMNKLELSDITENSWIEASTSGSFQIRCVFFNENDNIERIMVGYAE